MAATSDIPLSPWERGEKTRAEMAAELGVSERHLRRLMAQDREREPCDGTGADDRDESDHPYLALTDDPDRERGDWYDLRTDELSRDSGRVRIGDHNGRRLLVRAVNGGAPIEHTGRKKYEPDPDGLDGGKSGPRTRKKKRKRAFIDT